MTKKNKMITHACTDPLDHCNHKLQPYYVVKICPWAARTLNAPSSQNRLKQKPERAEPTSEIAQGNLIYFRQNIINKKNVRTILNAEHGTGKHISERQIRHRGAVRRPSLKEGAPISIAEQH